MPQLADGVALIKRRLYSMRRILIALTSVMALVLSAGAGFSWR